MKGQAKSNRSTTLSHSLPEMGPNGCKYVAGAQIPVLLMPPALILTLFTIRVGKWVVIRGREIAQAARLDRTFGFGASFLQYR